MSTENSVLRLSFEAAEDLSNYQYHFVVLDPASGKIRLPDSSAEVALGILQDAPASGQAGSVTMLGKSKLVANAALGVGRFVKPEYVNANDAGKGEDAGANWKYTRAHVLEAAGAEDDLCSVMLTGPFPSGVGTIIGQMSTATLTTAGAVTYTPEQLLGGLILRDPNGDDRSDVTPGAAQIIAALPQASVGNFFEFTMRNTADADETITITAGAGVTLSGTMTIPWNREKRFFCLVTGTGTVTIYALGNQSGTGSLIGRTSVSTINTAGAATYTGAQLLGGLILRDPNGADRSDLTPTGAQIAAALTDQGCGSNITGLSFEFIIRNTASAAQTITVTAGANITLSGTMTIAQNNTRRFLCVMTGASNATIYSLGTSVH
jgi:hypothetical protein